MTRVGLFAYGSLASPAGLAATLGRPVPAPHRAELHGWRRRWSVARDNERAEKSFEALDGTSFRWCLTLNLEPDEAAGHAEAPNGALFELDEAALERLDRRELRYERADVTAGITGLRHDLDSVVAYVARPEHLALAPPAGSVVLATYLNAVESAFAGLGPGERERFHLTTGAPPAPVVEARLRHSHAPRGNPERW